MYRVFIICQELKGFSSKSDRQGPWIYGDMSISEKMKFIEDNDKSFYLGLRKRKQDKPMPHLPGITQKPNGGAVT